MNTTDIDDKIILSARRQYLLARFKEEHAGQETVGDTVLAETFDEEVNKAYKETLQSQSVTVDDLLLRAHIGAAQLAADALQVPGTVSEFFAKTEDVLLPSLDTLHGASLDSNNHQILPESEPKVTHIVDFVSKIVANGFGYATADGSVYFGINSFEKAGHSYSRLEPWNKNDPALLADREGSLSKGTLMKRSPNHFALWKASQAG
ncbi:Cysteinyl-tRNA synthetase/mycothiol ligase [Cercophora samala]|uniref:Cysteinyl-tRNA synthetase/mycothiol ligase n=1 Tax=Cercophora samala TaxID=330535 RepID=A0AA40DAR6_9PEZI|nr:Cysteinyl-tRNA synthetase/mycothiol ligase [Cercophora samala]